MLDKKKDYIVCILFGVYIAAVLWIKLLSIIGDGYRGFLLPFHLYVEVWKGNWKFSLKETTKLMVYVTVYDGCDCNVVATPVIYKEG